MEKFWYWLREYSNKKVRNLYMNKYHHDRKCERCNTWTSEVNGCASLIQDNEYEYMTCNKCGYISKWDCRSAIPVLVKSI